MKKKLIMVLIITISLFLLMFAEYRYIMHNLLPYRGERGTVYIEIFGQVDTYYADPVSEMEK